MSGSEGSAANVACHESIRSHARIQLHGYGRASGPPWSKALPRADKMNDKAKKPRFWLRDGLQVLPQIQAVQLAQIVLIKVEFAIGDAPTVNEEHFLGFDPAPGAINETLIAASGQTVPPAVR